MYAKRAKSLLRIPTAFTRVKRRHLNLSKQRTPCNRNLYRESIMRFYSNETFKAPLEGGNNNLEGSINPEPINKEIKEQKPLDLDKAKTHLSLADESLQLLSVSSNIHEVTEHAMNAIENYNKAIELGGEEMRSSIVLFNLGLCQFAATQYDDALKSFDVAVEKDKSHAPAYRYLGDIYYLKGEYPVAISYYDKVFEMFPQYYGREYGLVENLSMTREEISASIEDMLAYILFRRGQAYYHLKSIGGYAVVDFKAILKLNTRYTANALFWLGKIEDRNGNYWTAISFYDRSLKENPSAWDVFEAKANAYESLGKEDIAEECRIRAQLLKRKKVWEGKVLQKDTPQPKEFDFEQQFVQSMKNK